MEEQDDGNSSQEEWRPQQKRVKTDCIIHCSQQPGKIIKIDSVDKWSALVTAATKLGHDDVLKIAAETATGSYPNNLSYHKNCRSAFLLKSKRCESKSNSGEQSSESEEQSSSKSNPKQAKRRRAPRVKSSKILLPKECIFCRKVYRYKKGGSEKLKARKIGSKAAREQIKASQIQRKDPHIAHLINNYDLASAEAHYHHLCYKGQQ